MKATPDQIRDVVAETRNTMHSFLSGQKMGNGWPMSAAPRRCRYLRSRCDVEQVSGEKTPFSGKEF